MMFMDSKLLTIPKKFIIYCQKLKFDRNFIKKYYFFQEFSLLLTFILFIFYSRWLWERDYNLFSFTTKLFLILLYSQNLLIKQPKPCFETLCKCYFVHSNLSMNSKWKKMNKNSIAELNSLHNFLRSLKLILFFDLYELI